MKNAGDTVPSLFFQRETAFSYFWETWRGAPDCIAEVHQIQFRLGLCPKPRWGSLRRSPRLSNRLGRATTFPRLLPLNAYGTSLASFSTIEALAKLTMRSHTLDFIIWFFSSYAHAHNVSLQSLWSMKTRQNTFVHNFRKCWPISIEIDVQCPGKITHTVRLNLLIYLFKRLLRDRSCSKRQTFTSFHSNLSKTATLRFCKVVWRRYLGEVGKFYRTSWLIYPGHCMSISIKIGQVLWKLWQNKCVHFYVPCTVYDATAQPLKVSILSALSVDRIYAVVLMRRNTGLARPSVRPSVVTGSGPVLTGLIILSIYLI